MKRFFTLAAVTIIACCTTMAQTFTEHDRKIFNEGQVLTNQDVEFASDDTPWSSKFPKRVYSLHNEGDETILTFSHSIYFDSQWVTFSKGVTIVDRETGDVYKTLGYTGDLTMDKLLIVKGCNKKNILVSLRFPKLKRKVKYIDVYSYDHKDDIKPSNRMDIGDCLGENLSVKHLKNNHKRLKITNSQNKEFGSSSQSTAGNGYKGYCKQLKEKRSANFTAPKKAVKFYDSIPFMSYTFGTHSEEAPGQPAFIGGPVVTLSKHCKVVMMDAEHITKPRPAAYPQNRDHRSSSAAAYMLCNHDATWAQWYISHGLHKAKKENDDKEISRLQNIQARMDELTAQNERRIEFNDLTHNANCDRVFIVKIPHIDKIHLNTYEENNPQATALEKELKSNATVCYGVEFYKYSAYESVNMLFFINEEKTSIDKCVEKMTKYLKFE